MVHSVYMWLDGAKRVGGAIDMPFSASAVLVATVCVNHGGLGLRNAKHGQGKVFRLSQLVCSTYRGHLGSQCFKVRELWGEGRKDNEPCAFL